MNSVLNCLISELSTFRVLIVAESSVACENVICVVDRLVIVALSKNALSAFMKSTDSCRISPLSTVSAFACKVLCAELSRLRYQ